MISSLEIQETWNLLTSLPLDGDLRVREAEDIELPNGRPLFALDALGQRHLLIPVADSEPVVEDRQSSGVHILPHRLLDRGLFRNFIDIVCKKQHLHELFSVLVGEILEALVQSSSALGATCTSLINRWRELFEREFSVRPGLEKLTGLFGELWVLRKLVEYDPGRLSCWVGPLSSRHDFVASNQALEVKTSRVRKGRFFEIHGLDQLEPPPHAELFLAALRVEQTPHGGQSIRELVDSVVDAGVDRYRLLALIAESGLTPMDIDACDDVNFRLYEERIYAVRDNFPRITLASFLGGRIPDGIADVNYRIDLSNEPPHPLSEEAATLIYASFGEAPARAGS